MTQITKRAWWIGEEWDIEDFGDAREDLALFDYALEHGWEAHTYGPVIAGLPRDRITYVKGIVHTWPLGAFDQSIPPNEPSVYHHWWAVADLVDNRYQNHRKHDTLKEVIDNEK